MERSTRTGPPGSTDAGALEDRLAILGELQDRIGRPLVVALDEFQAVLGAANNLDATIRSEIQHHDRIGYIFAGSHVGMMRELFTARARPFYAQAPPVVLEPLPPDSLADYIAARFERGGRGPRRVLGPFLDVTRGHPQRTMMLAAHLFAATSEGEAVDEATLEDALTSALSEADGELRGHWDAVTTSERRALAAVASGEAPFSRIAARQHGTSKGSTGKALRALQRAGDVVATPDNPTGWTIVDPLMDEWVRRRGL